MKTAVAIAVIGLFAALPARAAPPHEMSRAELRDAISAGQLVNPRQAMETVQQWEKGQSLDIRAFSAHGVYYRVLVKRPDGQLVVVVLNARTGHALPPTSTTAQEVNDAAVAHAPSQRAGAAGNGDDAGSNGNGNGNGHGNGADRGSGAGGNMGSDTGSGQGSSNGNHGGGNAGGGNGHGNGNGGGNGGAASGSNSGGGNGNGGGNDSGHGRD